MEVYCGQKSIYCNRTDFWICYWVFAIDLASLSSFCDRLFLQSSFLQSSFCSYLVSSSSSSTTSYSVLPHPCSIQVPVPIHGKQREKMAAAGPTELQLELDEFLGEPEGYLVILSIQITACYCILWMECYSMQAEWFLRDVLFIAEELPGPMQPDGEILTQEQLALLCLILNNHHFQVADIVRLWMCLRGQFEGELWPRRCSFISF